MQTIIQHVYNEKQQSLNLYKLKTRWTGILQDRDWSKLIRIWLNECEINDGNIRTLFKLNWPSLLILDLNRNKFTNLGIQLIINCQINNLKQLYLRQNYIGSTGVKHLVKANMPNLSELYICNCGIGSEGIKNLSKARWPNLKTLDLGYKENSCENKLRLDGWEMISQYKFSKLKKIIIIQRQSICWFYCVLLQGSKIFIDKNSMKWEHQEQIMKILNERNI